MFPIKFGKEWKIQIIYKQSCDIYAFIFPGNMHARMHEKVAKYAAICIYMHKYAWICSYFTALLAKEYTKVYNK